MILSCSHICDATAWKLENSDASDSRLNEYNEQCPGSYMDRHSLSGGTDAGTYTRIGVVKTIEECAMLCCQERECSIALMLLSPKHNSRTCFNVDCYDDFGTDRCQPLPSLSSRYEPALFHRGARDSGGPMSSVIDRPVESSVGPAYNTVGIKPSSVKQYVTNEEEGSTDGEAVASQTFPDNIDASNIDNSNGGLSVKTKLGTCLPYEGVICSGVLDKSKLYYYSTHNPMSLDQRLTAPMDLLKKRLTPKCFDLALEAICYRFYPQCSASSPSKPVHICNDCNKLLYGECAGEFQATNMEDYLKRVIRGCTSPNQQQQDEQSNCIKRTEVSVTTPSLIALNQELNDEPFTALNSTNTTHVNTTTVHILTNVTVSPSHSHRPSIVSSIVTSAPTNFTALNSTIHPNTTLLPSTTTTTTKEKKKKKPVSGGIKVSAGDDTTLTLPTNKVDLFASTWPKEKKDGDYTYKWSQIASPKGSHGYIAGGNTKKLSLSKLTVQGVYTFKLNVVSTVDKNIHGVGYVNVTVKKPTRINHPPRAEITQKEHVIQLPINTVILDGSKSTDDDKIVKYKWEELAGPIKKKPVFTSSVDSILQLKDLVEGVYKLRLTVTDSDGLTDQAEASVTVKKETDYPPKANAGMDVMIRLPENTVVLNGNKSTDDKGVDKLKYQWSKTADSPTCDMQGTDKSQLKISRLQEGTYVFTLKVTDQSEHSDEARVKVLVLPEKNTPPVARAGDDKEIMYPDDSTTLDASKSTDNSKIASYHWEQVSGPSKAKMTGSDAVKVYLSDLVVGTYVLKLTVTDDKDATGTDKVTVHVKKDHNEAPVAKVTKNDITVYLPTRDVIIDGSQSHDDEMIEVYKWSRAGLSPAAGVVVNASDHKPRLKLTNLVKGRYIFDLTVTDNKGLTGSASVTIQVKENPRSNGLVELHLRYDIESFTEGNKKQLVRKISVLLEVEREAVIFEELKGATFGRGMLILFYVRDTNLDRILDGKYVADVLKQKVGFGGKLFEYLMERAEPYICRKNCSDHGYCDKTTKQCICDSFWTANFLKYYFGEKESNCDWSILYLSVAVFAILLVFIGVAWSVCFCFARRRRNKRHARYHVLRGTEPEHKSKQILLVPNGKQRYSAESVSFSDTDESAEEATTIYEKKKHRTSNGHARKGRNSKSSNGTGYIEEFAENGF